MILTMHKKLKIALFFSNYSPYNLPRIYATFKQAQELGWNVVGIELARFETEYAWTTNPENLKITLFSVIEDRRVEEVSFFEVVRKLNQILSEINPDVIAIAGYYRSAMLASLFWTLWHRKVPILLSESHEKDTQRVWYKELFKKNLVKLYDAALVGGKPQKRYLIKLGMDESAIFEGYDVVNNEVFDPHSSKALHPPTQSPYFLTINRFVPKKNLLFLLSAYADYRRRATTPPWDLVLCGDGILRTQIEEQIVQLGLESSVHLPGFLQQDELLPYFAHAKCFIHASIREQWGLVVNEAMAAGLPVLVSNECGCFEDLVIEGVNGFGFDPTNLQQLVNLMLKMSSGQVELDKMGNAALEHIQNYSPDYFASSLLKAVKYTLANRH